MPLNRRRRGQAPQLGLPVGDHNAMCEAVDDYRRTKQMGKKGGPDRHIPQEGVVWLKNNSGSTIELGGVLEVGTPLTTVADNTYYRPYFNGQKAVPEFKRLFGVALAPVINGEYGRFKISGIVYAKIDVNHADHWYVDVQANQLLLESQFYGRARIIDRESGTGNKYAWLDLGKHFFGPMKAKVTQSGGIAPGGSGTIDIYFNNAASSTSSTMYWNHMDAAVDNIPQNLEILTMWSETEGKLVYCEGDCVVP